MEFKHAKCALFQMEPSLIEYSQVVFGSVSRRSRGSTMGPTHEMRSVYKVSTSARASGSSSDERERERESHQGTLETHV